MFVSDYLPKWLGVLLGFGGLFFVAGMFLIILAPGYASPLFLLPTIAPMLVLALWLLMRGVDSQHWLQRTAAAAAV
jgi:hypothetical protein